MKTFEVEMVQDSTVFYVEAANATSAAAAAEAEHPGWHIVTVRRLDADEAAPEES